MGFRFQRRIKLLPGVSLNFSKSGVSTSLGPRGAKVTIGHGKVRETVGFPGTGMSYTTTSQLTRSMPSAHSADVVPVSTSSLAEAVPAEAENGWIDAGRIAGKVLYWLSIGVIVAAGAAVAFMLAMIFSSGKRRR